MSPDGDPGFVVAAASAFAVGMPVVALTKSAHAGIIVSGAVFLSVYVAWWWRRRR